MVIVRTFAPRKEMGRQEDRRFQRHQDTLGKVLPGADLNLLTGGNMTSRILLVDDEPKETAIRRLSASC